MPKNGSKSNLIFPKCGNEAREWGRAGGKRSGESRRRLKTFRGQMEEILSENKGPEGKNIQELACRSIVSAITSAKSTPAEKMRVFEILLRLFGEWDSSKIEHRGEVIAGAGREG